MIVFHSWCHEDHLTFSYKLLTFPQLYQRIVLCAQWFCRVLWGVILWQIVENCCCSTTPLILNATSVYHRPNHIHHVSLVHQQRKENVLFFAGQSFAFWDLLLLGYSLISKSPPFSTVQITSTVFCLPINMGKKRTHCPIRWIALS